MSEFWEEAFRSNETMWGPQPTDNAKNVLELFQKHKIKSVLIPGFGYGRNAKVFYDNGIHVSGVEISKTAIEIARTHFGNDVTIHHGAVSNMPFDDLQYDAIYCYSLIHLLDQNERALLIEDCFSLLKPHGIMVFVALSTNDVRFGQGEEVAPKTFRSPHGLNLYFYDEPGIKEAFKKYNIITLKEINEPEQNPTEKHWMIVCQK